MDAGLMKKLRMPQGKLLLCNAPDEFTELMTPLPEGMEFTDDMTAGPFEYVQVFVRDQAELDEWGPKAIAAVTYDGLLWIVYPKKSSKIKTDISRDHGWEQLRASGWDGIAIVSVDETWSAMRLRPIALSGVRERTPPSARPKLSKEELAERTVTVPDDLAAAFAAHPKALEFYESIAYSNKKAYVEWITSAKRDETRSARVEKTIEKLENGLKNPTLKG
ncbi:YdeI/OmpD-associated family protein [Tumebacillus sp. DT12]|uniref:YdeI/OmpD-associated family protein n=1 Tax=Tumebacillus lacus TaxID=2995335 RepID=A0ABT3WYJ9_9BACL|nr:YdeI/OmpD-associated family protein [Tumebacillus lacus]MCX7569730.1 YdeI/OmpD-associated family protein [Tumebacillus lacus]